MSVYETLKSHLQSKQYTWLITGVGGFIGSNLLETLLQLNQKVVGLDNFSTGHQDNLDQVKSIVIREHWQNFTFIYADICNLADCKRACTGVDFVLHQAALGSVPRSVEDPITTNASNVTGFLNMLVAAHNANVKRFVYAASSSTYGDHPALPKVEDNIGKPLSPYAVTKYVNELYADVFSKTYGFKTIGLRYFNVFGPRQNPNGAYAAVIPKWTEALIQGQEVIINGDGQTSRDFCYVANVVQANILAANSIDLASLNQVYNIAVGERTSLNDLYFKLRDGLIAKGLALGSMPQYQDFRLGDVLHSLADVSKARNLLGYEPTHKLDEGLALAIEWYVNAEITTKSKSKK